MSYCKIVLRLLMWQTHIHSTVYIRCIVAPMSCCSPAKSCSMCCCDESSAISPWPDPPPRPPTYPCLLLCLMMRKLPHLPLPHLPFPPPHTPSLPLPGQSQPFFHVITAKPPPPPLQPPSCCLPPSRWLLLHAGDSMHGSSSGAPGTAAAKAEPGDSAPHGVPQKGAPPPLPACGISSPGQAHAIVHGPPALPQ